MSHLLRRPGAVPSLFSPAAETERGTGRRNGLPALRDASGLVILPFVVFTAELPFIRGAAEVLRLAFAH